jgi:hypothetical protein
MFYIYGGLILLHISNHAFFVSHSKERGMTSQAISLHGETCKHKLIHKHQCTLLILSYLLQVVLTKWSIHKSKRERQCELELPNKVIRVQEWLCCCSSMQHQEDAFVHWTFSPYHQSSDWKDFHFRELIVKLLLHVSVLELVLVLGTKTYLSSFIYRSRGWQVIDEAATPRIGLDPRTFTCTKNRWQNVSAVSISGCLFESTVLFYPFEL